MGKRGDGGGRRQALNVGNVGSAWRRQAAAEPEIGSPHPSPARPPTPPAVSGGAPGASPHAALAANPLAGLLSAYGDEDEEEEADEGGEGAREGGVVPPAADSAAAPATVAVWTRVLDPASGEPYYWNANSGEVCWELPELRTEPIARAPQVGAIAAAPESAPAPPRAHASAHAPGAEGACSDGDDDDDIAAVLALARRRRADLARQTAELRPDAPEQSPPAGRAVSDGAPMRRDGADGADRADAPGDDLGSDEGSDEEEGEIRADSAPVALAPAATEPDDDGARGGGPRGAPAPAVAALSADHAARDAAVGASTLARVAAAAARGELGALAAELLLRARVLALSPPAQSEHAQWLCATLSARVDDWRAGALAEGYFGARLGEACAQLAQLELAALPAGWSRGWDSAQARYYFACPRTGAAHWTLPDGAPREGDEPPPPPPPPEDEPPPPPPPTPPPHPQPHAAELRARAEAAAGAAAAPASVSAARARAKPSASAKAAGALKAARNGADVDGAPAPKRAALGSSRRLVDEMIHRWQAVRATEQAHAAEERARAEPPTRAELDAQRQAELREWHASAASDPALVAANPNFLPLGHGRVAPDAWRERIARAKLRARASDAAAGAV
ncbi:hypothetical protein KFE25_003225 [Diacronema lutheri]|uniref:WW domain-containing protein n=1 Tax=Diacronema lutheri TaxID=2081491 RepID=A0A8J5XM11_DIALT|nr:hypothetical protein KFE25_003225 [Diacronema lutheri]